METIDSVPTEVSYTGQIEPPSKEVNPDYADDFALLFSEEVRGQLHVLVTRLATDSEVLPENVLVSCFSGPTDPEAMDKVDAKKLSVASQSRLDHNSDDDLDDLDHGGDDSNTQNILARDEEARLRELQSKINNLVQDMSDLYDAGKLTEAAKRNFQQQISALKAQKASPAVADEVAQMPVYYATGIDGLTDDDPEDNPLSYAPLDLAREVLAVLVVYDRTKLEAAGIRIEEKSLEQQRLIGLGRNIMSACIGLVYFRLSNPFLPEDK